MVNTRCHAITNICPATAGTAALVFSGAWIDLSGCQDMFVFCICVEVEGRSYRNDDLQDDRSLLGQMWGLWPQRCRVTLELEEEEERDVCWLFCEFFSTNEFMFVWLPLDSRDCHHISLVMWSSCINAFHLLAENHHIFVLICVTLYSKTTLSNSPGWKNSWEFWY